MTADRRTARGNRSLHAHSNRSTRLPSTRSWQARLNLAQPPGSSRFDTFASHDGLSAAPLFCKAALPHEPSAKVWRIMSNEYFLPMLRSNPMLRNGSSRSNSSSVTTTTTSSTMRKAVTNLWGHSWGHAIVSDGPSAWPALVKGLLVPRQSVRETVEAFKVKHNMAGGVPTLGFHLRCVNVDGDCSKGQVINACQCAYKRLRALENATAAANGARGGGPVRAQLFLATMQSGVRRAVTSHFRKYYSREVISYGEAMEKQEASEGQERARLVDALIVAASDAMLLSSGSTFGHVVRGFAEGGDLPPKIIPTFGFDYKRCKPVEATPEPPMRNEKLLSACGLNKTKA